MMTNVLENTNLPSLLPDQVKQSQSKKMQTRLTWESAYLQEQQNLAKQKTNESGQATEASLLEKKEAENHERQNFTATAGTAAINPQTVKKHDMTILNPRHLSHVTGTFRGPLTPSQGVLFDQTVKPQVEMKAARLSQASANQLGKGLKNIKLPNFRLVDSRGQLKLWIRVDKIQDKQRMIKQIVELFSSLGHQLNQLTLNGELVWNRETEFKV